MPPGSPNAASPPRLYFSDPHGAALEEAWSSRVTLLEYHDLGDVGQRGNVLCDPECPAELLRSVGQQLGVVHATPIDGWYVEEIAPWKRRQFDDELPTTCHSSHSLEMWRSGELEARFGLYGARWITFPLAHKYVPALAGDEYVDPGPAYWASVEQVALDTMGLPLRATAITGRKALVHGDHHTRNVLRKSKTEAVLIDMEMAATGMPMLDLGAITLLAAMSDHAFMPHANRRTLAAAYVEQTRACAAESGDDGLRDACDRVDVDDMLFDMAVGEAFRNVYNCILFHFLIPACIQNGVADRADKVMLPWLGACARLMKEAAEDDAVELRRCSTTASQSRPGDAGPSTARRT